MVTRRSFMAAILAAGVAPHVVRSGVLMPVREIWTAPAQTFNLSAGMWHFSVTNAGSTHMRVFGVTSDGVEIKVPSIISLAYNEEIILYSDGKGNFNANRIA